MTLDLRGVLLALAVLVAAGAIYAMSMSGGSGKPVDKHGVGIGATDPKRFPWVLEEMDKPPYGWRFVDRFPTRTICNAKKRAWEKKTGLLCRCRLDDRS